RALFAAVQRHDERAVTEILGAGTELVSSDDKVQDTLDREQFVQKYQEMHRLVQEPRGVTALYIGAENWPFPIPLVSRNGAWRFDSYDGANDIRFRRIGENEVTAIGICHALVARETNPGANRPVPFHGYYFRTLSKSAGGFAAIAYPALYRSSGVMTFIVNQEDVVYEKDLGPNTAKAASAMTTAHLDATWTPAESMPRRPTGQGRLSTAASICARVMSNPEDLGEAREGRVAFRPVFLRPTCHGIGRTGRRRAAWVCLQRFGFTRRDSHRQQGCR